MSDSYVECLVKAKQPTWAKFKGIIDHTDGIELSGNVRVYHFPAGGTGSGGGSLFPEYVYRSGI